MPFTQLDIHPGGTCYVDSINDSKVSRPVSPVQRAALFHIDGWMADADTGVALPEVYVEISGAESGFICTGAAIRVGTWRVTITKLR